LAGAKKAYIGAGCLIVRYWRAYGGWRAFAYSPYLHVSLFLTAATWKIWSREEWWESVGAVIPSLLGFSLGGMAIILSFGGERFLQSISGREDGEKEESPYIAVTAAFAHFVLVQVLSLLVSILCLAFWRAEGPSSELLFAINQTARVCFWGFGFWLYLYAICLSAATLFAVFRVATWFDALQTDEKRKQKGL
jgi:hypothetical protein